MARMTKQELLEEIKILDDTTDFSEKNTWQELKDELDYLHDTLDDDSGLFPNGRDYEAENEDGPY